MNKQDIELITGRIDSVVQNSPFKQIDQDKLKLNKHNMNNIIDSTFWNPQKSSINTLNSNNVLLIHKEKDAFKYLEETHGAILDKAVLYEFAEMQGLNNKQVTALLKNISIVFLDFIKLHSQRSNISMCTDMFAKKPRIEMMDEIANVVFTHTPYPCKSSVNKQVINDYKEHFTQLDEVLSFFIASRFARDRKKAYLWMKCSSDWGKGFFIGLLASLGLSVELSVKEIEAMFEGKPVGRSMVDFKKSIVIVIDEFKTVKSELKQLQSEISLAPKNQLNFKVEIFAKLFLSAENVNSLVGEYGVEDQFINRFNYMNLSGDLTKRALFIKLGSGAYFDGIQPYIARYLNQAFDEKIKAGKAKAELESEQYLRSFMQKYGLEQSYSRLSKGIESIATDIARKINNECSTVNYSEIQRTKNGLYLKKPAKYIENYIDENFSYSDKSTITRKRDEIMVLLSKDGKGSSIHRMDKYTPPIRAVLINPELIND